MLLNPLFGPLTNSREHVHPSEKPSSCWTNSATLVQAQKNIIGLLFTEVTVCSERISLAVKSNNAPAEKRSIDRWIKKRETGLVRDFRRPENWRREDSEIGFCHEITFWRWFCNYWKTKKMLVLTWRPSTEMQRLVSSSSSPTDNCCC